MAMFRTWDEQRNAQCIEFTLKYLIEIFSIADELLSFADAMVEQKEMQKLSSFPSDRLK